MKRYVIVGAVAGAVLIALLAARRGERAGAATHTSADSGHTFELGASDLVRAARVDLIAGVPVSGTLDPSVVVRIASPIPDVVEAVLVREGEAVHAGQALARFRTSAVEPAALSAEAQRLTSRTRAYAEPLQEARSRSGMSRTPK
jgi:multidrug efflux pump subunit AcrA (membrane-fusion protein)